MKKISVTLSVLLVMLFVVPAAFALQTEPPAPVGLDAAWAALIALVGWPAFQVAAINLLKLIRVIPDGAAGTVTFWSGAVAFLGVAYLVFTGQLDLLSSLDATLGQLATLIGNIIVILGGFTASLAVNKLTYSKVRGVPLIGFSHSISKAK
jgi:hypothetical protein